MAVEADIGLGIFAELGEKVDSIHHHLRRGGPKPIHKTVGGNILTGAAPVNPTPILVTSDRCAVGRVWNILQLNTYGPDPHTTVASVMDVYTSSVPDSMTPPLLDILQGNLATPSSVNYSRHVQWCASGESVYGLIYTPVANTEYNLILDVAEYRVEDVEAMSI